MPCYSPLKGFRSRTTNPVTGKRSIVFRPDQGFEDLSVDLPCGQCLGCRLDYSKQWAIRCVHEAQLHYDNCFLTLTFDDEHLPVTGEISKRDMQLFLKKLRKKYPRKENDSIRYFLSGEYGELKQRPHYHVLLFNMDFKDKQLHGFNKQGQPLYTSEELKTLWPYGAHWIGEVSFQSAGYVARYCLKKVTGQRAADHYQGKQPEFCLMSRRPAIGKEWFEKYHDEMYPENYVVINGKKCTIPKYYDNLYEKYHEREMQTLKAKRKHAREKSANDNTLKRLRDKETCVAARITSLKRN